MAARSIDAACSAATFAISRLLLKTLITTSMSSKLNSQHQFPGFLSDFFCQMPTQLDGRKHVFNGRTRSHMVDKSAYEFRRLVVAPVHDFFGQSLGRPLFDHKAIFAIRAPAALRAEGASDYRPKPFSDQLVSFFQNSSCRQH